MATNGIPRRRYLQEPGDIRRAIGEATRALVARVEALLENGDDVQPRWRCPWRASGVLHANVHTPWRPYKGINQHICTVIAEREGWETPAWITHEAITRAGGRIQNGEWPVILVGYQERRVARPALLPDGTLGVETAWEHHAWLVPVFNVEQCAGLPPVKRRCIEPWAARQQAEAIVAGMPLAPAIEHVAGMEASYSPIDDAVTMPLRKQFASAERYYETLFHELAHATGHPCRLDRHNPGDAGTVASGTTHLHRYAMEELVAEFGAAHVMNVLGMQGTSAGQPAAYLAFWHEKVAADPGILVKCAYAGEKAARWILGKLRARATKGGMKEGTGIPAVPRMATA